MFVYSNLQQLTSSYIGTQLTIQYTKQEMLVSFVNYSSLIFVAVLFTFWKSFSFETKCKHAKIDVQQFEDDNLCQKLDRKNVRLNLRKNFFCSNQKSKKLQLLQHLKKKKLVSNKRIITINSNYLRKAVKLSHTIAANCPTPSLLIPRRFNNTQVLKQNF